MNLKTSTMKMLLLISAVICSVSLNAQLLEPSLKFKEIKNAKIESSKLLSQSDDFGKETRPKNISYGFVESQLKSTTVENELLDSVVNINEAGDIIYRELYKYNESGLQESSQIYNWDTTALVWKKSQVQFTYSVNGVSKISSDWNIDSNAWINDSKEVNEFNENNELTLDETYYWEDNNWIIDSRTTYELGMDNENKTKIESYYKRDYITNQLEPVSRNSIIFQGESYTPLVDIRYVPSVDGEWVAITKIEQRVDSDGYNSTQAFFNYDTLEQKYVGISKSGYSYSDSMDITADFQWDSLAWDWTSKTEEISVNGTSVAQIQYSLEDDVWVPFYKIGYDGDFTVYYDLVDGAFIATYKEYKVFDEYENLTSYTRYYWEKEEKRWYQSHYIQNKWDNLSGEWQLYQKIEVRYNKMGETTQRIQAVKWGGSQDVWYPDYTYNYKIDYNEKGERLVYTLYHLEQSGWDDENPEANNWVLDYTKNYYYSIHSFTSNKSETYELSLKTYPNPTTNNLTISGTSGKEKIELFSINGTLLKAYKATNVETKLNINTLQKGQYIVKVDDNSYKILKQ